MVVVERAFRDLFAKLWSCLNENTPYSMLRWGISPRGKCPSCLATHGAFITVVHLHSKSLSSLRLVCRKGIPTRSISLKPKACLLCEQLTLLSPWVKHWMVLSILSPRPCKQSHACVSINPTQTSQPMGAKVQTEGLSSPNDMYPPAQTWVMRHPLTWGVLLASVEFWVRMAPIGSWIWMHVHCSVALFGSVVLLK